MKKKIRIYHVLLTNGEWLNNIRLKDGPIELMFNGVGKNFIAVEDDNGKTVVLSKYHVVKAELARIE